MVVSLLIVRLFAVCAFLPLVPEPSPFYGTEVVLEAIPSVTFK